MTGDGSKWTLGDASSMRTKLGDPMTDHDMNRRLLQAVFNEMRRPNAERSARWHEEEP